MYWTVDIVCFVRPVPVTCFWATVISYPTTMTWLTGKPTRTRSISWAENDNDIKKVGTTECRDGRSILNNHLLHWISSTKYSADGDRTVVYMADISVDNEIILERMAKLDCENS